MSLLKRLVFPLSVLSLTVGEARATVTQPGGTETMPAIAAGNNEVACCVTGRGFPADADTLMGLFKYHVDANGVMGGDAAIDWRIDAHTTPGTFSPQCGLSGTIVLHGGGCKNSLGWYNATNPPTAPTTIYQLVPADLTQPYPNGVSCKVGDFCPLATRTTTQPTYTWADPLPDFAANIRNDPNWKGGEIGFALMAKPNDQCPQVKYSQAELNDKNSAGQPWVTALIYQSISDPGAYYIAFEDRPTCTATWKGCVPGSQTMPQNDPNQANDGDFNDFVFYVKGLSCSLGGDPCTVTGAMGICAGGVTECNNGGMGTYCRQTVKPIAEACDNLDNDCNGMVDEGDGLCPTDEVCSQGACHHFCDDTEFPCAVGLTCDTSDRLCKDAGCIGKTCNAGQVCQRGQCVGGCVGVMCPHGQSCVLGNCVAACDGITCPSDRVCENGACQPPCNNKCRTCKTGTTCNMTSGVCAETGCENKTCPAGQVCVGGNCQDGCQGVTCPGGQQCMDGRCKMVGQPDAGTSTGSGGAGGFSILGTGGQGGTTGSGATTGPGSGGTSSTGSGGTIGPKGKIDTCKCETAEGPGAGGIALLLAGLAIAIARRGRVPIRARTRK